MKEVEQLVYARMIADTEAVVGLVPLLGSINRILHAYQSNTPPAPGVTFNVLSSVPGEPSGNFARSHTEIVQFNIFANNYTSILFRLKRLFDGHIFSVPSNYTEVGSLQGVFDWEGPDGFDEQLQIQRKDVRYRFFAVVKAQSPI